MFPFLMALVRGSPEESTESLQTSVFSCISSDAAFTVSPVPSATDAPIKFYRKRHHRAFYLLNLYRIDSCLSLSFYHLRRNPTFTPVRRSASMAALSAGSLTPTSRATWPQRIGRRLDGRDSGHFEQASTNRSSFA